ncbi:unnamed protein product [Withania somnifera]
MMNIYLSRLFPRSNSSFFLCLCRAFLFLLFSTFVLAAFYSLSLILGSLEVYWGFLERLALSLGGKALSLSLRGLGCSGALALTIAWSLQFCISSSCNMMAPSGASGSGSGEGAGGRGFSLTDLFGSSSPANSEAGLNQPAPDSPNPGDPAAPPIAQPYDPLQEDGERRRELNDRLSNNTIGCPLPEDIVDTQFQIDLKIEKALRSDRVQDASLFEKRHLIRGKSSILMGSHYPWKPTWPTYQR